MKTPIHPALREHFAWTERMKKLLANPAMDALTKRLKNERERMASIVAASLNLKDINR
jgi:hypothetical protein